MPSNINPSLPSHQSAFDDVREQFDIARQEITDLQAGGGGAGVIDVMVQGETPITGHITFAEGSNVTLTQTGQTISIASTGGGGPGVSSFAAEGETPLTGAVTISEGANITLTQVGQNIEISATGGSGTGYNYFPGGWV